STGDTKIFIFRPSKLATKYKDYNPSKNFQIWLKSETERFRPNHLRILIDLNLRSRSRPEIKAELLSAFDSIYYGTSPDYALRFLIKEDFQLYLNDLMVIGTLHQLMLLEQEYSYNKESHFDPSSLFLQGWVREFIDSPKELDNMCMSVAHGQPPLAKYVSYENKKDKKHKDKLENLWYIKG
ncbi:hypothetical protein, partial [Ferroplasma sp.]|uniref:hypothetical protein n=1 Tax=Ferroplasma sp. TaxID=2591003 RepID=UPI00307F3EB7